MIPKLVTLCELQCIRNTFFFQETLFRPSKIAQHRPSYHSQLQDPLYLSDLHTESFDLLLPLWIILPHLFNHVGGSS